MMNKVTSAMLCMAVLWLSPLAGLKADDKVPAAADPSQPPLATTRQGKARGFRRNSAEIFLGMPYGAETSGARRFLPPAPPASWSGVRDATRLGQRAPQDAPPMYADKMLGEYGTGGRAQELLAMNEPMGEDCLVLNVLTPRADNCSRPVLVELHGGAYSSGSGAALTLADRFVSEEDVVVVTVNHRLSVMGLLYLGDLAPEYEVGNPLLLDLVAALRWVRDNIAAFGGDPDKVTIFGGSGGGGKVGYLLDMPQAQGLFRGAIIESPALLAPVSRKQATEKARQTLRSLSIDPSEIHRLREVPVEKLAAIDKPPHNGWMPVLDGHTILRGPWDGHAPAGADKVPVIVGSCAGEATIFLGLLKPALFSLDWAGVSSQLAAITRKPEVAFAPVVAAYRQAYPAENASDIFFRMVSVGRDVRQIAGLKSKQSAPVYVYRTEYNTGIEPGLRAFHNAEFPLAFRLVSQPRAENLSKQIAGAWAAFARGGNPNHTGLPTWEPYRGDELGPIMQFALTSRGGPDPAADAERLLIKVLEGKGN